MLRTKAAPFPEASPAGDFSLGAWFTNLWLPSEQAPGSRLGYLENKCTLEGSGFPGRAIWGEEAGLEKLSGGELMSCLQQT